MPDDNVETLSLPPHSQEAEQAVLGALLLDCSVAVQVRELIATDDFYIGAHREIYRQIDRLVGAEEPVDVITVAEGLKAATKLDYVGGLAYLGAIAQNVPTAANLRHYATIVRERAHKRAIIATAADIGAAAAAPSAVASAVLQDAQERFEGIARASAAAGPLPLDLAAMAAAPIPERHFRVGRIMPKGVPGLWTGHGGAGKTQAALHLACCIALGLPFFGEPVEADRVAYVATEDDAADLHYRLAQQLRVLGAALSDLGGRLFLYDLTTTDPVLMTASNDGISVTSRYGELRSEFRRREIGVAFLDNFATLCAVDLIKPAHATQAIALCDQLVPDGGNAVLIAHVDKQTAKAGHSREGYSGTAAFHNRARWRWFIFSPNHGQDADVGGDNAQLAAQPDDGRRVLEVQKVNGLMQMRADGEIEHYGYRNEDRKPKEAIRVTGAQAAHSANG